MVYLLLDPCFSFYLSLVSLVISFVVVPRPLSARPAFLYSDEFSFGFPLPSLPPAHWLPLGAAHACLDARAIDEAWRDLQLPTAAGATTATTTTAGAAAAAHALTSALGLEWQEYAF